MALTKYASLEGAELLELKSSPERSKTASLRTLSDFHDYRTEDGFLYARIRAISSRVNKNHDGWPTQELAGGAEDWEKISSQHTSSDGFTIEASKGKKYGFSTFLGKPNFIDHHNSDPDRARGVVVDAKFSVVDQKTSASDEYWSGDSVDPEHNPPSEVELLIEVDAKTFPKYAEALVNGDLDGFSMGCDVDYSKCSHCGHEASTPDEYCSHIQMKGAEHTYTSAEGKTSSKKSYENCYGIKFFEISGVFDPADETALAREIRAEGSVKDSARRDPFNGTPPATFRMNDPETPLEEGLLDPAAKMHQVPNPHTQPIKGPNGELIYGDPNPLPRELNQDMPGMYSPDLVMPLTGTPKYNDGGLAPHLLLQQRMENNPVFPKGIVDENTPRYQGKVAAVKEAEYKYVKKQGDKWVITQKGTGKVLSTHDSEEQAKSAFRAMEMNMHGGSIKTAEPDAPQVDQTKAPEDVNTIREEKICPLCGSDIDDGKCGVCGYEEPPESLQNPDLTKALDVAEGAEATPESTISPDPSQEITSPEGEADVLPGSPLGARNPQTASTLTSEMRWAPQISGLKTAAPKPQGNEPIETVTSDETSPVTSAFRTAQDMIQAAKRNHKENTMSDQNKVAAEPADASGKAKTNVDVTGVGGVDQASPEALSADKQVDVTDKGGIIEDSNAAASQPSDGTDSLPSGEQDNAGFQPGGEKGPDTQTFPNTNESDSAVTNEAFPGKDSANHGTQPADPVGKAQDRIDVEQPPHDQVGPDTQTWSGTSGNGVTKQLDPVTNVPTQSGGVKASGFISLAALKLAEAEVSLGIINEDDKYNRLAELEGTPEDEIVAEHRALAKVKTAGLTRTASKDGAGRVPSFKRIASEGAVAPQPVDDALLDSAVFSR